MPKKSDNVQKYFDTKVYETNNPKQYGLKGEGQLIKFVNKEDYDFDEERVYKSLLNVKSVTKKMLFFFILSILVDAMVLYKVFTFDPESSNTIKVFLLFVAGALVLFKYKKVFDDYHKSIINYIENLNWFSDKYFSEF